MAGRLALFFTKAQESALPAPVKNLVGGISVALANAQAAAGNEAASLRLYNSAIQVTMPPTAAVAGEMTPAAAAVAAAPAKAAGATPASLTTGEKVAIGGALAGAAALAFFL